MAAYATVIIFCHRAVVAFESLTELAEDNELYYVLDHSRDRRFSLSHSLLARRRMSRAIIGKLAAVFARLRRNAAARIDYVGIEFQKCLGSLPQARSRGRSSVSNDEATYRDLSGVLCERARERTSPDLLSDALLLWEKPAATRERRISRLQTTRLSSRVLAINVIGR